MELEKLNYTPVIVCIERELMQIKHGLGIRNVAGLTPTEIEQQLEKDKIVMKPYREALTYLKSINHDWTDNEKRANALTGAMPFKIM